MSSEADRNEDIHIRYKMTDYVCRISYDESREEFHFISARYAAAPIRLQRQPNLHDFQYPTKLYL